MSKFSAFIGILAGVAIIVMSVLVFNLDVNFDRARTSEAELKSVEIDYISAPSKESDKYYGGDAYTGIQQAAAQTANNLVPVFDAIQENNVAIQTLNSNLIENAANEVNNADVKAKNDAKNITTAVTLVRDCFGYLILAIGVLTTVKYIGAMIPAKKKEKATVEMM